MPPRNDSTDEFGRLLPKGLQCRGPGQYRARILVDGVRHTKAFPSVTAAIDWLEEMRVDKRRGAVRDLREAARRSLGSIIDRYVEEELGADADKRGAEEERVGHIPSILGDPVCAVKMARLRLKHIAALKRRMTEAGLKPATIVRRLNIVAAIINHAMELYDIDIARNPAKADAVARPPGADRKRDRRLADGEEERLLAAMDLSCNRWDADLVRWAIAQAMRQGETFALRWGDIDEKRRIVRVYGRRRLGTKGGDAVERRPLMPEALAILARLPRGGPDDPVFPAGSQKAFSTRFRRLVVVAGIEDLTYHDLRHEATSRLAQRFPSPLDLMRVTGHKTLVSLNRYYNVDAEELAAKAARRPLRRPRAPRLGRLRGRRFQVSSIPVCGVR